jgi:hypothetical protein
MMLHFCVGMVTLVTCMCVLSPNYIYMQDLTQRSITVAGGVGACDGHVSVTRPGDIATGCWPVFEGG